MGETESLSLRVEVEADSFSNKTNNGEDDEKTKVFC